VLDRLSLLANLTDSRTVRLILAPMPLFSFSRTPTADMPAALSPRRIKAERFIRLRQLCYLWTFIFSGIALALLLVTTRRSPHVGSLGQFLSINSLSVLLLTLSTASCVRSVDRHQRGCHGLLFHAVREIIPNLRTTRSRRICSNFWAVVFQRRSAREANQTKIVKRVTILFHWVITVVVTGKARNPCASVTRLTRSRPQ